MSLKPSTIADWQWRQWASAVWAFASGVGGVLTLVIQWMWPSWRPIWIACVAGAFVLSGVSFLCHSRARTLRARLYEAERGKL